MLKYSIICDVKFVASDNVNGTLIVVGELHVSGKENEHF